MYKLVAIDIDGTLLDTYGQIPNENKKELKFKISTVDDINLYNKEITDVIKRYLSPVDNTEYIYTKWGKYIKPNPYKVTLTRPYPPVND